MVWATTVVAALLLCLDIFYSPHQAHHKFVSYPLNSMRIVTPFILISSGTFFFQVHQMHNWCFRGRLITLELLQREETGSSWLWGIISCLSSWASGQLHRVFLLCFAGSPKVIGVSPVLWPGLKVGHHCFQVFGESTIEAVPL